MSRASPPRALPPADDDGPRHGAHTLRVVSGEVVGIHGADVFVELSPRMQGVIARRRFECDPRPGDRFDFRLHGQEDGLWALSLESARPLATWTEMEVGSQVRARVLRENEGGLELKVGALHAFMPRSHTGLPRDRRPRELVGSELVCEVIEIDPARQRVFVSRKLVLQREREGRRDLGALAAGQIVHGRIARLESYGAFVRFGAGLEGLIHVSNVCHERISHPGERLQLGEPVEAKILWVRRGGKRIGLGIKQLTASPWESIEERAYVGQLVEAAVVERREFGLFLELEPGVVGLLHRSETLLPADRSTRELVPRSGRLAVRIVGLDREARRLSLSMLHEGGALIAPEEVEAARMFAAGIAAPHAVPGASLGSLLARALGAGTAALPDGSRKSGAERAGGTENE